MTSFPLLEGLPAEELQATRFDGESYLLGGAHVPIGIPDAPATRAAASMRGYPARLIPALATAAWIWGAVHAVPTRREYLVDLGARWRPARADGLHVVESVVHPDDLLRLGRIPVTSPLRTALDLARFREPFAPADADAVRRLAETGAFGLPEAIAAMERGRNLAGKHRATARLREALSPS